MIGLCSIKGERLSKERRIEKKKVSGEARFHWQFTNGVKLSPTEPPFKLVREGADNTKNNTHLLHTAEGRVFRDFGRLTGVKVVDFWKGARAWHTRAHEIYLARRGHPLRAPQEPRHLGASAPAFGW